MIQNSTCSIAEHGLIGNTRTAALISKNGSLVWCCFPHFDSPSIFASILDPKNGGDFTITSLVCESCSVLKLDMIQL